MQSANTITNDTRFGQNCGTENTKKVSEEKNISEDECFKESSQEKDVNETSLTIARSYGEKATGVSLGGTFSEDCESLSDYDDSISSNSNVETLDDDIIEELVDQAQFANVEDEIIRKLRSGKVNSFAKTLAVQANLLKKVKVNVAIAGESGTGKSSFINAFRGVEHGDETFAKVGFGNTTMEVNIYRHPKNEQILLHDLPGYNTTKMTFKGFLEKVIISDFDLFLIFFRTVPTSTDKLFVAHLRHAKVQFCFIRSKIDEDIDDALDTKEKQKRNVLFEIKKKINQSWDKFGDMNDANIFFISSYEPSVGEMDNLISFIEKKVAPAKFEAVLFSIPTLTKEVVQKKYKGLKRRVLFLAIRFAVFYSVGLSYDSQIKEEIEMFYRVFDLDKDLAKNIKNRKHPYSVEYIGNVLTDFRSRKGSDLASVNKRYRFCKTFLINLLNELAEDAKAMYTYIVEYHKQ
ncbi:interferon-inducible GTPase 1-like [Mytilus trossulus]|uniref:interferon-inducible GTPase 1-like n=1 Tax=Mytilus trossulus TaxID=6551 RepID=UPI003005ADAE